MLPTLRLPKSVKPEDFSLDSHRRIFLRMSELIDTGRTVDIVTLSNELARYKEVEVRRRCSLPGLAHRGFAAPSGH